MKFFTCLFSLLLLVASGWAADPLMATKPFVPTSQYEVRQIEGWQVRVNRELLGPRKDVGDKALALLATKLHEIRERVPAKAVLALQRVTIWLGVDDHAIKNASYHPNAEWLRAHGWNPDKVKGVEIGNAAVFIEWSRDQPMMVLHELAHSYHDQVLGYADAEIKMMYERAKRSGKYDAVKRNNGRTERAYALTNEQEYFAECSEAYFGLNDFQPFNREELKTFDPDMFRVVEAAWAR